MKNKVIAVVVLFALVGGGVVLVKKKREQLAAEPPPASLPVVVGERVLQTGPVSLSQRTVADVLALRDTVLASRLTAYVSELPLYEGERFRKGALLAKLDVSQAEAEMQRADATLAQTRLQESTLAAELAAAESTLKAEQERTQRLQALYKIQGVSLEQLQVAEAALAGVKARHAAASAAMLNFQALLKASNAAREAARENLRYAVLSAPFDGVVSQRLAQPGDLATPGKPLLKVFDSGAGVRLLVNVPERLQPVALSIGEQRLKLQAWPEAGPQGLRRFEARSNAASLLPGSRVEAKVVVFQSDKALFLPRNCLLNDNGADAAVVTVQDGKAAVRKLALAASGEEGAATLDTALDGQKLACASPDILARLAAGAPFQSAAAQR